MADLPHSQTSDGDADKATPVGADHGGDIRTPRWVIAFAIIALVLVVLVVIQHLAAGGFGAIMNHGMHQP
jgi:hypothetical protein